METSERFTVSVPERTRPKVPKASRTDETIELTCRNYTEELVSSLTVGLQTPRYLKYPNLFGQGPTQSDADAQIIPFKLNTPTYLPADDSNTDSEGRGVLVDVSNQCDHVSAVVCLPYSCSLPCKVP